MVSITECVVNEAGPSGDGTGSALLTQDTEGLGLDGADVENMEEDGAFWAFLEEQYEK